MSLKQKSRQNILYIIIALFIVVSGYIVFEVTRTLKKSVNYVYAKNGRITSYEEARAIVVREEEIIDTSSFEGEMQIKALDATKVAKNDTIVSFIQKNDDELSSKINEVDRKIQELIENTEIEYSQEAKVTLKTIEQQLYELVDNKNSIYDVSIFKKDLYANLEKKIVQLGKVVPKDSELNALIKEREEYEKQINSKKQDLKASHSALVSYRVDGYEKSFPIQSFSNISVKKIKQVKYLNNQQVPVTSDKIKLINNFYSYLLIITKSSEAKNLMLNDTVKVSVDSDFTTFEKATVEYIIDEKDERIIVLKIKDNIEKLSQYRAIDCYLIWWNYEGLKVQSDAIYDTAITNAETGEVYANVKAIKLLGSTDYKKEVWIKVEEEAGGFAIISNYSDEELIELGVPEEIISNRNKVNMYDKIIVN